MDMHIHPLEVKNMLKYDKKSLLKAGAVLIVVGAITWAIAYNVNTNANTNVQSYYAVPDALIISGVGCLLWGAVTK